MLPPSFNRPYVPNEGPPSPCALPAGRVLRLSSKEEDVRPQVRKARVMTGLILLVFIGILIGFVVARVRKRMGLGVTWSTWVTTVVVIGFILLLLYATSFKH
jgi:transcriptional regulatory protein LevR